MKTKIFFVLCSFTVSQLKAQDQGWSIILLNKEIGEITLDHISDSVLVVNQNGKELHVNVNDIQSVHYFKRTSFKTGFLWGIAIGFVSGFGLTLLFYQKHETEPKLGSEDDCGLLGCGGEAPLSRKEAAFGAGVGFALVGGVVGGLINKSRQRNDTYDMQYLSKEKKIRLLSALIIESK